MRSFLLFLVVSSHPTAWAQIAVATQFKGEIQVTDARGGTRPELRVGETITKGETVSTGPDAELQLLFSNGNLLQILPNSKVRMTEYELDRPTNGDHSIIDVREGEVRFVTANDYSGERRSAIIKTPNVSLMPAATSASGGDLYIKVKAEKTESVSLAGDFILGTEIEKRKVTEVKKLKPEQMIADAESAIDLDEGRLDAIKAAAVRPVKKEPFDIYKENHPNFAERYKPRAYIHLKNRMDAKKRKNK